MQADWTTLLSQLQGLGLRILVVNQKDGTVVCQVPDLQ